MNCEQIRTLMESDFLGSAGAQQQSEVDKHLQSCPECAAYAARVPAENEALSQFLRQGDDEGSFRRVQARLDMRLGTQGLKRKTHSLKAAALWWAYGAAAVLALTAAGFAIHSYTHNAAERSAALAKASKRNASPAPARDPAPNPDQASNPAPAPQPEGNRAQDDRRAPESDAMAEQQPGNTTSPSPEQPQETPDPGAHFAALPDQPIKDDATVIHSEGPQHKPAPEAPRKIAGGMGALATRLNQLQKTLRDENILDDIEQLSIALNTVAEPEDRMLAEDAGLHLERVMTIEAGDLADSRADLLALKEISTQFREIQDAVKQAPPTFSTSLKRVITGLDEAVSLGSSLPESGDANPAWIAAEEQLRGGNYTDAADGYRAFAERNPTHHRAATAHFTQAFLLQAKLGQGEAARAIFQELSDAPHNKLAGHALYHLADSHDRAGDAVKALATYIKLRSKGTHVGIALNDKIAFLEAKVKGQQLANPGWGARVPKGEVLLSPRNAPGKKKAAKTISK